MIDIIGNIKVDESKPERVKYLLACIRSYEFLNETCRFLINLDSPSGELYHLIRNQLESSRFQYVITTGNFNSYGSAYESLMNCRVKKPDLGQGRYIINFMEDQFMVVDDEDYLIGLVKTMHDHKVDVCMCGFHQVELNSATGLQEYQFTRHGIIYDNSVENYTDYSKFYGKRYYLGVNFITSEGFARKFWNRDCGPRPHEYEVPHYSQEWLHRVMIPRYEIQAAVDDDHGAENSCLLKRGVEKWSKIMLEINMDHFGQLIKSK